MRRLVIASTMVLCFALSGCYDTKHEVLGPKEGVMVPGLDGRYIRLRKDEPAEEFTVFWAQHGTDYRLIEQGVGDKQQSFGTFRVVPVGADLYVVQLSYESASGTEIDSADIFAHTYFRITRSGGAIVKLEELLPETNAAWPISQRDGIDIWDQIKKAQGLSGSPAALNRFLRDLNAVSFKTMATYTRLAEGGQ